MRGEYSVFFFTVDNYIANDILMLFLNPYNCIYKLYGSKQKPLSVQKYALACSVFTHCIGKKLFPGSGRGGGLNIAKFRFLPLNLNTLQPQP